MAGINPWQIKAHALLASAQRQRAITYRARAADLLTMANSEEDGGLRAGLRGQAARYQELAMELESGKLSAIAAQRAMVNRIRVNALDNF